MQGRRPQLSKRKAAFKTYSNDDEDEEYEGNIAKEALLIPGVLIVKILMLMMLIMTMMMMMMMMTKEK